MLDSLYDFFINILFADGPGSYLLEILDFNGLTIFGNAFTIGEYLAFIMSLVSFVIILVLCCLFIKKIVSLVGGLIR